MQRIIVFIIFLKSYSTLYAQSEIVCNDTIPSSNSHLYTDTMRGYFLFYRFSERNNTFVHHPFIIPLKVDSCIRIADLSGQILDTGFMNWGSMDFKGVMKQFIKNRSRVPEYWRESISDYSFKDSMDYIIFKGYILLKNRRESNRIDSHRNFIIGDPLYAIKLNEKGETLITSYWFRAGLRLFICDICR